MTGNNPRDVIARFYELYSDGTPESYGSEQFMDLWADDIVVEYAPTQQSPQWRRIEGKEAMRKEHGRVSRWMRNRRARAQDIVVEGDSVAVTWAFWATAAVHMPGIPAGSRLRMDGADFYTVRDGLVVHLKQFTGPMVPDTAKGAPE